MTTKQLEDAFQAAAKERLCAVGRLLSGAAPEHREVIEAKIKDEVGYSAATISRVLRGLDFPVVSSKAISEHRRGACRCRA